MSIFLPSAVATHGSSAFADSPGITFVCCVESGWLEDHAIRMIESLRLWGGRMSRAPVMVINPRFGPPISSRTRKTLKRLDAEYVSFTANNPYSWKGFLNKHFAMAFAERRVSTPLICWLDSDVLILGEPSQLILQDSVDFAACAPDKTIGSTGPDDPHEPFWTKVCSALDMVVEDLPWITTACGSERIRLYFNSGVFVYRTASNFSEFHLETTLRVMNARISSRIAGSYFTQHTLGLAMIKMGLRWSALPHSHNYTPTVGAKAQVDEAELGPVKILHYHDAMWPPKWPLLISLLQATHPQVSSWLLKKAPMANIAPIPYRVLSKIINELRAQRASRYLDECETF